MLICNGTHRLLNTYELATCRQRWWRTARHHHLTANSNHVWLSQTVVWIWRTSERTHVRTRHAGRLQTAEQMGSLKAHKAEKHNREKPQRQNYQLRFEGGYRNGTFSLQARKLHTFGSQKVSAEMKGVWRKQSAAEKTRHVVYIRVITQFETDH